MKFISARSLLGLSFLSMILIFQNCSKARFTTELDPQALNAVTGTDGTGTDGGDDNNCHPGNSTANKIVKVLFVVDTSGSNVGEGGETPTDPGKKWRSGTINNFISAYSAKSNFYYGMISFQASSAKAQIKVNNTGGFTNSASVVQAGYNSFVNTSDSGSTPYKAALTMAKSIIAADLAANAAQNASYVMVMVSDGMAKDYKSPEDVKPDAAAIKALAPNQISLNTVYYYASALDNSQTTYLRNISSTGGGVFLTANSSQVLKIDDLINLPPATCQ